MRTKILILFQKALVFGVVSFFVINTTKYFLFFGLICSFAAFKTSEQTREISVKHS